MLHGPVSCTAKHPVLTLRRCWVNSNHCIPSQSETDIAQQFEEILTHILVKPDGDRCTITRGTVTDGKQNAEASSRTNKVDIDFRHTASSLHVFELPPLENI